MGSERWEDDGFDPHEAECWDCGGSGEVEHQCFEDSCCCLDPEPDVCRTCRGRGYLGEEPTDA